MTYLFDLEGTLCDISHRLHHIRGPQQDWDAFHQACVDDEPIWEVIQVARALDQAMNIILIITGRSETVANETKKWLDRYQVPYDGLYMRRANDHREDYIIKGELLTRLLDERNAGIDIIAGAFEDRQQVVDMYRKRGIRVFQVADGKY